MDEETARLLVQTALPIDAIDQITGILPGRTVVLVWVDLQDRPDLLHRYCQLACRDAVYC
jgi:hypothetical protein